MKYQEVNKSTGLFFLALGKWPIQFILYRWWFFDYIFIFFFQ